MKNIANIANLISHEDDEYTDIIAYFLILLQVTSIYSLIDNVFINFINYSVI